ncbi:MAG: hypothetical protein JOZ54_24735 [Acidobacteria bacterium]|nr:hypothetical protein [Acidobacteriota bacterium]
MPFARSRRHDAELAPYQTFSVQRAGRAALLEFITSALTASGCTILHASPAGTAPFRFTFVTPWGERLGIVVYAFTANQRVTQNRPADEHRFQLKYGSKPADAAGDRVYDLWHDPYGLYTTLLVGINPERGFFVGADPVLNSPTRLFISKEFKEHHAARIEADGWHAWTRVQRPKRHVVEQETQAVETMVGGTAAHFLKYVLFEREVVGEDQGHRQLVAERFADAPLLQQAGTRIELAGTAPMLSVNRLHALEQEFELGREEILQLIARAPRLKMAVRGWVAERHLQDFLVRLPEIADVESIEQDGQPDFRVRIAGGRHHVLVECKNVLRDADKYGHAKLDFQKTRAAKGNPCSRYYSASDFHVVAACLHARTEVWEYRARLTADMAGHKTCAGRLASSVVIDGEWSADLGAVLTAAAG